MADSQATTVSTNEEGKGDDNESLASSTVHGDESQNSMGFSLDGLGDFFILPAHLTESDLIELRALIEYGKGKVTRIASQARFILTAVSSLRRLQVELRASGVDKIEPVEDNLSNQGDGKRRHEMDQEEPRKRLHTEVGSLPNDGSSQNERPDLSIVSVLRKDWLTDSIAQSTRQPISNYLVLRFRIGKPSDGTAMRRHANEQSSQHDGQPLRQHQPRPFAGVSGDRPLREGRRDRNAAAMANEMAGRSFMPSAHVKSPKRHLVHETTTENEAADPPEPPDWVKQNRIYSCQRHSPLQSLNEGFVGQLKKIRLARTLVGDEIGVRAYSTIIASVASYPYEISSRKEILTLPGCDERAGELFQEYQHSGRLHAADDVDKDPELSIVHEFYKIWGVGAATAREFYYERGWRDHDDVIEYGWRSLSRHQQIGLKYFAEFEQKMNRSEVELIASIVTYHAKQIADDDIQCAIVGGYRRGSRECSDVDLILSHPEEEATRFLINPLVQTLEKSGWITHTLILAETTSSRDQETLPLKSQQKTAGFDTLDKALIVWQDPNWATRETDLAEDPEARNPNVHRRVDIIIAPWRVVGCAVTGWTSGTTFQRDLRRYARKIKGWKFDSSGVRDLGTGHWIDVEQWRDKRSRAKTMLEAEKRVFESFGLEWIPPEERNTG